MNVFFFRMSKIDKNKNISSCLQKKVLMASNAILSYNIVYSNSKVKNTSCKESQWLCQSMSREITEDNKKYLVFHYVKNMVFICKTFYIRLLFYVPWVENDISWIVII